MLNVAHVKNDVKLRPLITKFGTLIENELDGAVWLPYF